MKKTHILSVLILIFTIILSSCKSRISSTASKMEIKSKTEVTKGIHQNVVEEDDTTSFIKNGTSSYIIVVSKNASNSLYFAINELQNIVFEATNYNLEVTTDDLFDKSSKFISLGETSLLKDSNIGFNKNELGFDGYIISTTEDNNYFIVGASDDGTTYGVYDFLEKMVGFKQYSYNTYSLNKSSVVNIKKINISEVSDFSYRAPNYGYMSANATVAKRMRINNLNWGTVNGVQWHNSTDWIPISEQNEHPYWFSNDGTQLCYTAHGDEKELDAMLDRALETFKTEYSKNPKMQVITFTLQDISTWCNCEKCNEYYTKYGTDSAVLIPFMNRLSEMMEEYVTSINKDDPNFVYDIDLLFFAYFKTTNAPVIKDNEGNFIPADDSMICGDHVAVYYAPIYLDYTQSIYAPVNQIYHDNFLAWSKLTKKMYLWVYSTNFKDYWVPYDTYNTMQELYQFIANLNVVYVFNQSVHNRDNIGLTAWHFLKAYLDSELKWNVNADVNELTNKFFDAMYGKASETMKSFYYSYRNISAINSSEGKYQGTFSVYIDPAASEEYWSYPVLVTWMNYIDKALSEIEYLKEVDINEYNKYYANIVAERISVAHILIEIYRGKLSTEYYNYLVECIKNDCALNEVGRQKEGGTVSAYLDSLK